MTLQPIFEDMSALQKRFESMSGELTKTTAQLGETKKDLLAAQQIIEKNEKDIQTLRVETQAATSGIATIHTSLTAVQDDLKETKQQLENTTEQLKQARDVVTQMQARMRLIESQKVFAPPPGMQWGPAKKYKTSSRGGGFDFPNLKARRSIWAQKIQTASRIAGQVRLAGR